jgi:hypothetical protein
MFSSNKCGVIGLHHIEFTVFKISVFIAPPCRTNLVSVNNHNMVTLSVCNYYLPALTVSVGAPHARMLSDVKTTLRHVTSMAASRGSFYVVSLWVGLLWPCYFD